MEYSDVRGRADHDLDLHDYFLHRAWDLCVEEDHTAAEEIRNTLRDILRFTDGKEGWKSEKNNRCRCARNLPDIDSDVSDFSIWSGNGESRIRGS